MYVVPGRSSETTSAHFMNAETKQIHVMVPHCLVGTDAGNKLADRILHDRWMFTRKIELAAEWLVPTPINTVYAMQRMIRKATVQPSRKCETCQTATTIKCQGCKGVYYCIFDCQKANWKKHKKKCKMAPLTIEEHVSIAAPDFQCFWQYQHALISVGSHERLGIVVMSRERFAAMFGNNAIRCTLNRLAVIGKPCLYMTRVFGQIGCTRTSEPSPVEIIPCITICEHTIRLSTRSSGIETMSHM